MSAPPSIAARSERVADAEQRPRRHDDATERDEPEHDRHGRHVRGDDREHLTKTTALVVARHGGHSAHRWRQCRSRNVCHLQIQRLPSLQEADNAEARG